MTGQPNKPLPNDWDNIPGARGCTPQSCSFRDNFSRFKETGWKVIGVSTDSSTSHEKFTNKFGSINSKKDLKNFIQERSAHVTQTTLYGYIKTRIGSRYAMMFEDEVFSKSINLTLLSIFRKAYLTSNSND